MNTKKIFILTQTFPHDDKETPFLLNELIHISKKFSEVIILPFHSKDKSSFPLPPNITVVDIFEDHTYKKDLKTLFYCMLYMPLVLPEVLLNFSVLSERKLLGHYWSLYMQTVSKFLHLKKKSARLIDRDDLVYSFWFNEWVTLFSLYKKTNKNIVIISRAHGFDLYENRHLFTFIPFRKFSLKYVNKLITISKNGHSYLTGKYPELKDKFHLSYLGSKNHNLAQPLKNSGELRIISCSNVVPLKRIHLIAEAVAQLKIPVKWVHIGSGPELSFIEDRCKELGIGDKVTLKGHMANDEIINFYAANYFDVFINVSETEGLPVSLMEAASFGIPLIATDVGGNSEIVTAQTCILINKDFIVQELADILTSFNQDKKFSAEFRKGIREFWEKNFNSDVNSVNFVQQILLSD